MLHTILFDLDQTLLDFEAAQKTSFRKMLEDYDIPYSEEKYETYSQINDEVWKEIEKNALTKEEAFKKRFDDFFMTYNYAIDGQEAEDRYRYHLNRCGDMMPYAKETLSALKEKGIKIYSASNGVYQTQIMRLEAAGLSHFFDGHFISEEVGYSKPDQAFFATCQTRLGLEDFGKEVLMIGDNPYADIEGAYRFGLMSCFYNPEGKKIEHPASYEIDDLRKVLELL